MRKLLTICAILLSLSVTAQWQLTGSKVRYVNGIGIPTKDTAAGIGADSSQILIRPADSSLYIKYKRTWQKVGAGGTMGGSGTTNYVPKFTASTTLGNSQIFDNGTNVGIGTTSTLGQLDVFSGIYKRFYVNYPTDSSTQVTFPNAFIRQNSRTEELRISQQFGSGFVTVYTDSPNTEKVRITDIGNVGIGYTTPATRLAVSGRTLINTNTDNGVDALQVSGSMNVSAKATVQTLSVTNNAQVDGTTMLKGRTTVNPSATTVFSDRLFEISGTAGTTGSTQFAFVQNPTFGTPTTIYSWYNSLNVTSATTSYGLYYDTESGSITNKWGLYFVGGSRNYLANTLLIGTTTDNGVDELQVNGSISGIGFKQAYVTKTGAYTATNDDYIIDCTSGSFTVTLPASSGRTGRILIIKNSGAGTITVDGNASETIDGATTYSLATQYATVQIVSDGTNWKIISKF